MWNAKLISDDTPRNVFADKALMSQTHLAPPQITELSLQIASRAGRPAALSVDELVDDLRGAAPAPAREG
jgi:hypothetical protein